MPYRRRTAGSTLLLVASLSCLAPVHGQGTSEVACTIDLWTLNDHGQTPCLAAALEAPCTGVFNIPSLPPGAVYNGPPANHSTQCQCNTVTYSLVSACAACQGRQFISWSEWITNCTTSEISIITYPLPLPSSIQVPSWAYLNLTTPIQIDDFWNATASLNNHNAESLQSLTSTSVNSVTSGLTLTAPTISPSPTPPAFTRPIGFASVRPGVIAAGAVGGFLLIACSVIVVLALLRKRRTRDDMRAEPGGSEQARTGPHRLSMPGGGLARLYDPADPSTFPPTPPFEYRAPGFLGSPRYPTGGLSSIPENYPEALAQYSQLRQQPVVGPSMQRNQVVPVVYV